MTYISEQAEPPPPPGARRGGGGEVGQEEVGVHTANITECEKTTVRRHVPLTLFKAFEQF